MALYVCKKWEKGSREGKVQSPKHLQKKNNCIKNRVKNVLLVRKITLQHFLYKILTQFE